MHTPGENPWLDEVVMFPNRGPDIRGIKDPLQADIDRQIEQIEEAEAVRQREKIAAEIAKVIKRAMSQELTPAMGAEREDYLHDFPHTD